MSSRWSRFRQWHAIRTLRALGWVDASWYWVSRVLDRATGGRARLIKYYFVAQPIGDRPLLPAGRGGNITVRQVRPDEPVTETFPRPAAVIRQRFHIGAQCYAAFKNGDLAGYLWLMFGPYPEDEVRSRFVSVPADRTVWDFDVYVDPRDRLGLTFARLWDEVRGMLRDRGVTWSVSRISAFNAQSMAVHGRLGAKVVGRAVYVCFGPVQLTIASLRPFIHASLHATAIPEIRIGVPHASR